MFKYKFIKNGRDANSKSSLLIGTIHNTLKSRDFISKILNQTKFKFDYFLLELNENNFHFIKENKLKISEFYEFTAEKFSKEKIIFFDLSLEFEIKEFQASIANNGNRRKNFFDDYLLFRLDKFLYYKLKNINNKIQVENYPILRDFHKVHKNLRENAMKETIKKFIDKNNLIVVGLNHYDEIERFIKNKF